MIHIRNGKAIILAFILSLFSCWQGASAFDLSDSAQITLLTCSPGSDLYSAFGHNGIRVTDYKQNIDVVFNYGTFDFNQPGFYVNFVRGKMRYMLAVDAFTDFMSQYVYEERSVTEQVLNLTTEDKQKVFAFLYTNALPENREYYYDFFWDNCATRPRDVFDKVLGNRLQHYTDSCGFEQGKTLHDMLRIYVHKYPWVDFGFDLGLGMPCEIIANPRDQTFLPEYLAKYIQCSTVDGQPFVAETKPLLTYPLPEPATGFKPMYLTYLLVFVGLVVSLVDRKNGPVSRWFDFTIFFITGLVGILLLSLWLFTVHYSVPQNLNVLWAIPTHAVVGFFILKGKKAAWLKYYFLGTAFLMFALGLAWNWLPQPLNPAFIPVILTILFRSMDLFRFQRK